MANTLNLGSGNWGVKDSSLLGYKNRKNGRFIPETFDVSRGSAGTRVNQSGLIETPEEILSGELITNGSFATDSDWVKQVGWSISGGKAIAVNVPNTQRLQSNGGASVIGKTYKYSFEASNISGFYTVYIYGLNVLGSINTEGLVEGTFVATSTNGAFYISGATVNGLATGEFDNVSVVEVNRDNLARIDYLDDATGVLLTEPQSTNLITNSNLSNWGGGRATINENANISPSGENDAIALVATAISDDHSVNTTDTLPLGEVTYSVFAKQGDKGWIRLWETSTNILAEFDIVNGVVGSTYGGVTDTSIEDYGNGWFRCSMTYSTLSASAKSIRVYAVVNDSIKNYLGDGVTEDVYLWGAQIEALGYPTSLIPTSGAIATRLADVVTNAGDVNNFNSEEGVLFFEGSALADDLTNRYITISNGTTTDGVRLYYSNSSQRLRARYYVGGVAQCSFSYNFTDVTQLAKIAFNWKVNDFSLWVNGVLVGDDNVGTVNSPNIFNTMELALVGTLPFFGKTKNIQVFDEALTDIELQTLTTI